MLREILFTRRKSEKKDYTKDTSIVWFILFLCMIAAYIVIDTIEKDGGEKVHIGPVKQQSLLKNVKLLANP